MTNPFIEPLVPDHPDPSSRDEAGPGPVFESPARRDEQQQLQSCGYMLAAISGIEMAVLLLSLMSAVFSESDSVMFVWVRQLWSSLAQTESSLLALLLAVACSFMASIFTFLGGMQLITGGDLRTARAGAILASIPLVGTLWGLAFPIGLWTLRRINRVMARRETPASLPDH